MRIDLAGDQTTRRGRRKRRKGRRSRGGYMTFDSAITLPQPVPRDGERASRKGGSRGRRSKQAPTGKRGAPRRGQSGQQPAPAPGLLRRIRWRSLAQRPLVFLVVAALTALTIYASTDARFFVYGAEIEGGQRLGAEAIYRAAEIHELNIFWVDPEAVEERIGKLPGVKAVDVRCALPGKVTIEVEEREPVVMWRATSQEQDLWLDEEGYVLPYHGDVNSPGMVFVVDYAERSLEVGQRIEPEGVVDSALQLATAVEGARVFFYQPYRGLSFTQRVGGQEWPVYVGTSQDLPHKIQVVQALTEHFQANGIQPLHVDVRWPDHPVFGVPQEADAQAQN